VANPDGSISKGMAPNSGCYRATTLAAPDLQTFAAIIADLGVSPCKTLMLGGVKGAPDEAFLVLPEDLVIKNLKLDPADPESRKAALGFHEHPHHHMPMVARLKENTAFGGWVLFDRDAVHGMPPELAGMDRDDWLDAMDTLLPGFRAARRLTLPSTSSRIEVDGKRSETSSYHVFVQVSDPHDIARVWGQLLPKAMVTPAPLPSWEAETMIGFMRPKYSRSDPSQIVAWQPWSIFDPSTGQTNRLVFDGAPVVRGPRLRVLPAVFEMHDGDPLDLSAFEDMTGEQIDGVEAVSEVKVKLERSTNGSGVRVVGVSSTSPTLSLDLELETKDRGICTIKALIDQGAGHTRCQSPFRESSSWAAYFNVHEDGQPFLYDSGTNTKYVLPGEITGDALFDFSHDGLALHMGKGWSRWARHVALWGRWLFWSGSQWVVDERLRHMTLTRDYLRKRADDLVRDAKAGKVDFGGKDPAKAIEAAEPIAKTLRAKQMIASVVELARSNADLVASVDQWDRDIMLLGGERTIDLRDGSSRFPVPTDYILKRVACAPSADPPTLWLQCLETWTAGDKEMQAYLQRMCGYMLTGSIEEEVFFFFYGLGKNGKTKFAETIKGILCDYAGTMGSEVLMQSQTERHPTEIARLRGLRLAVASEVEKGRTWAENKIKSLTGGDTLQARFMRCDIFEFRPTFKLLVIGNNRPPLRAVDEAIRRRMHLIPFTVQISEDQRDPKLAERLRCEWPQILGWMIAGCKEWQRIGLQPPAAVVAATNDYLSGEDTFEQWREACTTINPKAWETNAALFASWKAWAERANEHVGSQKAFAQQLVNSGCIPDKQAGERGYFGLKLRDLGREAYEAMQKQGLA
jgi:putative DNA primase/helicase